MVENANIFDSEKNGKNIKYIDEEMILRLKLRMLTSIFSGTTLILNYRLPSSIVNDYWEDTLRYILPLVVFIVTFKIP